MPLIVMSWQDKQQQKHKVNNNHGNYLKTTMLWNEMRMGYFDGDNEVLMNHETC